MNRIAVIGVGQLGSRHLQSLARLKGDIVIQALDNSDDSLKIARQRFDEVSGEFRGRVEYINSIDQLSESLDLVIVATGSVVRKNTVVSLLESKKVKYLILEKFLFSKLDDYQEVSRLLTDTKTQAWVNCPRRMFSFYKSLKGKLGGEVRMNVTGNGWGLASNGIHFLDLFSFITGTTRIELSNRLLNKGLAQSKRAGYIEVTGTIYGVADSHSLELTSFSKEYSPGTVAISDENNRFVIFEDQVSSVLHSSRLNQWKWETSKFDFLFQSQLTHLVVNELLSNGDCGLTPFFESSMIHQSFLACLIDHAERSGVKSEMCLIT
jgi:predicted dehydrogenase